MLKRFILITIIFTISLLQAKQYFSGVISQDTRWTGDVYIDGDVIVPRGIILSIESKSRIFFKPKSDKQHGGIDKNRAELIIDGILLVKGISKQGRVIFTSESSEAKMNDWYGIIIKNLYEKSSLSFCTVEFGYKGITCYGSAPELSDCQFQFNFNAGISCEIRSTPVIKNCFIMGNGFAGLYCEMASSPVVFRCVITQNNYGVLALSRSEPNLGYIYPSDIQSIGENRIFNNFDFNIYNHSAKNIYAQKNIWDSNNPNEIRSTIYDNIDNPSYGQVIFQPILNSTSKTGLFPIPVIPDEVDGSNKSNQ